MEPWANNASGIVTFYYAVDSWDVASATTEATKLAFWSERIPKYKKKKERDKEKLKWDEWTREKFFDGLGETEHALNILNESRSQTE